MSSRPSVLMIDDNVELLDVVSKIFDPRDFLFVTARDGSEGLFKAQNQSFHTIICDLKMPKLDGFAFIKEYRQVVKTEVPILLYSGHISDFPMELNHLKHIYRMEKPGQAYELLEKVRSLCELYQQMPKSSPGKTQTNLKMTNLYGLKGVEKKFAPDSIIFNETDRGAEVFHILEGEVELFRTNPDGSSLELSILGPGSLLGDWVPEDQHFRTYSAKSRTLVRLACYSQLEVQSEVAKLPIWMQALVQSQHERLQSCLALLKKKRKAG